MPIYEYRCEDCGFQDEYLQKVTEPPLTVCPSCGKPSFRKLLSAAGFQLKGSGWYATDFKGGSKPTEKKDKKDANKKDAKDTKPEAKPAAKPEGTSGAGTPAASATD